MAVAVEPFSHFIRSPAKGISRSTISWGNRTCEWLGRNFTSSCSWSKENLGLGAIPAGAAGELDGNFVNVVNHQTLQYTYLQHLQLVLIFFIWFLFPLHLKKVVCNQCNQSNHHLAENCTPSNPQGPGKGTVVSRWLQSTRKTNAFRTSHRVSTSSGHQMDGTDLPPSHKTLSMIRMHVSNIYIL